MILPSSLLTEAAHNIILLPQPAKGKPMRPAEPAPALAAPPEATTPKFLRYRPQGIPQALRDHPHWLVCDHTGAPVEVPDQLGNSKTNPSHWGNFATASRIAGGATDLWPYIVLTDNTPVTIFDVDFKARREGESVADCKSRLNRAAKSLERLRELFPRRYESRSKSGNGFHIVVFGKFAGTGGKRKGDWSEVEIYTRGHGVALTGHASEGCSDLVDYGNETIQKIRDEIKGQPAQADEQDADAKPSLPAIEGTAEVIEYLTD